MVCLRCSGDELLKIDEATARQSLTLANFLQGDDYVDGNTGGEFAVKDFTRGTLEKVFEYCKKHVDGASSADEELRRWDAQFMKSNCLHLDEVILAADYLSIKSLVDLCCQTIADIITACKTPSDIRTKFDIIRDFTPEEQEDVCRENQWAFESKDVPFSLNNKYPVNILCLRARLRGGQDPNSIHDGLIVDIFTRMPAKSLARCRCVSRAWASIIRRPSFSALFSSRRKPQLLFACSEQETNDCKDDGKLFFLSSHLPQTLEDFSFDLEVNHQTKLSLLRGEEETDISKNNGESGEISASLALRLT